VALASAASVLLGLGGADEATLAATGPVILIATAITYFATLEAHGRQTLGKAATRLVVTKAGDTLSARHALMRATAKVMVLWVIPEQLQAVGLPWVGLMIAVAGVSSLLLPQLRKTCYDLATGTAVLQSDQRTS
jgi:hypothetical protein